MMPFSLNQSSPLGSPGRSPKESVSTDAWDERLCAVANRICYDALANEYDDATHETCRNFDGLNRQFFRQLFPLVRTFVEHHRPRVLEVGPGPGHLTGDILDVVRAGATAYHVIDVSEKMLDRCNSRFGKTIDRYVHGAIGEFACRGSDRYDLVIGLLSDPYLTPSAINALSAILTDGGTVALSFPAAPWATTVRGGSSPVAIFSDRANRSYFSFSFCWELKELTDLCKMNGLIPVWCKEFGLSHVEKLSEINRGMLASFGDAMPVLSTLILRKGHDDSRYH